MMKYPKISEKLPEYYETEADGQPANFGMFGYKSMSVEHVLKNEDLDGIQKAHDLGWINPNTPIHMQTLSGISLVDYTKQRGKLKSAEKLIELGY